MTKIIPEILHEFSLIKGVDKKKEFLKKNASSGLKWILFGTFKEDLEFYFDELPYFKPDDAPTGMSPSSLDSNLHMLRFFTKGNPDGDSLTEEKRIMILSNILESIHISEAYLLEKMFKKDLKINHLNEDTVRELFPDLLPPKKELVEEIEKEISDKVIPKVVKKKKKKKNTKKKDKQTSTPADEVNSGGKEPNEDTE